MDAGGRVIRLDEAEEGERCCEVAGTRELVVAEDRGFDEVLVMLRYPFELIGPCFDLKLQIKNKKEKQVHELSCMLTSNMYGQA